ncbi:hypothetical protein OUZ56_000054 [Daphnia magna]|uniref:Uncharacterized protein n=1 Tax=Daphnia magna TaxID=35525 RepID=A0ABQ9ZYK7_9CRUS|nr:hypothetical protein OUZ56_000054 [Daphnia magna]
MLRRFIVTHTTSRRSRECNRSKYILENVSTGLLRANGFIKSECQLHLTSLKQQVIMLILKMFSIYKLLQQ